MSEPPEGNGKEECLNRTVKFCGIMKSVPENIQLSKELDNIFYIFYGILYAKNDYLCAHY